MPPAHETSRRSLRSALPARAGLSSREGTPASTPVARCAALGGALFLGACSLGSAASPYCTEAVYEAPVSRYHVELRAGGEIPPGADTASEGDGTVWIHPLGGGPQKVIKLEIHRSRTVHHDIAGVGTGVSTWTWEASARPLRLLLDQAGYTALSTGEVEETQRAISLALIGPKATLMDGQTKHLRVPETRFSYERCKP